MLANTMQGPTNLTSTQSWLFTQEQRPLCVDSTPTYRLGRSNLDPVSPDWCQIPSNTKEETHAGKQTEEVQDTMDALVAASNNEKPAKDEGVAKQRQADTHNSSVKNNSDTQAQKPVTQTAEQTLQAEVTSSLLSPDLSNEAICKAHRRVTERLWRVRHSLRDNFDFQALKTAFKHCHDDLIESLRATNPDSSAGLPPEYIENAWKSMYGLKHALRR